jgi:asparagine synthase (glutamine-hydrolysing)
MCAIAGIFAYREQASPISGDELLIIRDSMLSRGPDDEGLWIDTRRRIGLAHRRLAIIDLAPSGAQPMKSLNGALAITFNGEIYNYKELRIGLEGRGYRFRSESDTEVLLQLYAERGSEMVKELRGMFAFAIWDESKQSLFLARDSFGIKPLYYSDDGGTFRFASQVKALVRGGGVDTSPEPAGHVGFFLWGSVPEPFTLHKGIKSLPAGKSLWIERTGKKKTSQFFDLTAYLREECERPSHSISQDEASERFRAALLDSIRHHMVSDVPVGVFLSSGLDSSTIAALAAQVTSASIKTVTTGFEEFKGTNIDEVPYAEKIANHYHTSHKTSWVSKEDFDRTRQDILEVMDQPTVDGLNSYFVCKSAAEAGLKVALSGLGGDELLGGYPSFKQIPLMTKIVSPMQFAPAFGKGFRYISSSILKNLTSPKYAAIFEYGGTYGGAYLVRRGMYMPWELTDVLDVDMVREGWEQLQTIPQLEKTTIGVDRSHLKVMALETSWYMRNQLLRDIDWASMAHSLEVRVPLVDVDLYRAVIPLLNSNCRPSKRTLTRIPDKRLPDNIVNRKKQGFVVPTQSWLFEGKARKKGNGIREWAKQVYNKR